MKILPKVTPLKFWSQKVLPLVYDDSLSYYEVLGKVVFKLNEVIEYISGAFKEEIAAIISKYFVDLTYDSSSETIYFTFEESDNG